MSPPPHPLQFHAKQQRNKFDRLETWCFDDELWLSNRTRFLGFTHTHLSDMNTALVQLEDPHAGLTQKPNRTESSPAGTPILTCIVWALLTEYVDRENHLHYGL